MNELRNILLITDTENVSAEEAVSWLEKQIPYVLEFGKKLLIAILIIWVGHKLIKFFTRLLEKSMKRSNMEESVSKFFLSIISVASNIVLIFSAAMVLGLKEGSFVAVIGSAGLSIGLALQGSLSNFAGGVLILLMKPFRVGDYIISNGNEGTVTAIDIFYTRMLTADNRLVVIPNGTLSNSSIINATNEPVRRLDLTVAIDCRQDHRRAGELLKRLGQEHELRLPEQDTEVFIQDFESGIITLGLRIWVKREDYWTLRCDIMEKIKAEFDRNEISLPYEQLGINLSKLTKIT